MKLLTDSTDVLAILAMAHGISFLTGLRVMVQLRIRCQMNTGLDYEDIARYVSLSPESCFMHFSNWRNFPRTNLFAKSLARKLRYLFE